MSTAAEVGDCDDDDDVRNVIERPRLLPRDAGQHTEDILQAYKTLRSASPKHWHYSAFDHPVCCGHKHYAFVPFVRRCDSPETFFWLA